MEINRLNSSSSVNRTMFGGAEKPAAPDKTNETKDPSVFEQNKPFQSNPAEMPDLTGLKGTNGNEDVGKKLSLMG